MSAKKILLGIAAVSFIAISASAHAASVTISATTDIYLASQLDGASVSGYYGNDSAPSNSPVALAVSGGSVLTFSATGSTSVDGGCFVGADGGCYTNLEGYSPAPASNTYHGPADALVGIFLGSGVTSVQDGPSSLDFNQSSNQSLASQSPALDQIFFIGDGLTGTGTGGIQQFIAPVGATRLYLAVTDSIGGSTGNVGSLDVAFTGATALSAVPLPAALPLFGTAILGVAGLGARRGRRS